MAAKKAETTETIKENKVEETKSEATPSIDIEAIIKKAIAETAQKYQDTIAEQENKIKELESKVSTQDVQKFSSNRRVKVMYMGSGTANFTRGRINVDFKSLFDTHDIRYDIFEEMYDQFRDWFTSFELVILDKEVREDLGLEYGFSEHGADKDDFYEMLKLSSAECLAEISKLSSSVSNAFLRFFVEQHLNHDQNTLNKFTDITNYYSSHLGIADIQNAIQEMISK